MVVLEIMARSDHLSNHTGRTSVSEDQDASRLKAFEVYIGAEKRPLERVKVAQLQLQALGYNIGRFGADGIYGPDTMMAVSNFQRDEGLRVNGLLTPATDERLGERTEGFELPGYGVLDDQEQRDPQARYSLADIPGMPEGVSMSDLSKFIEGGGLSIPGGGFSIPGVDPSKVPSLPIPGIDPSKAPPIPIPGMPPSAPLASSATKKRTMILGMTPVQAAIVGGVGVLSVGLIAWGLSSPSKS